MDTIGGAEHVHGQRLSLSQLVKAHHTGLPKTLGGEFEITLRDANDPRIIIEQFKQKNLVTKYTRLLLSNLWGWANSSNTIIGFCEEVNPANEYLGCIKSKLTLSPTSILQSIAPSKSGVTYTYSASYGAPAADRTFQTVFLCYLAASIGTTSVQWWAAQGIQAYTVLTTPRTQTTSNLLDITYRISFAE